MSEIKICANKTCKESSRNSKLQFFGFPKNLKTFRLWVERSGREDLLKKTPQSSKKRYFLCEKHFNKFEIMLNGKKILPYDAVPLEFGKIFKKNLSRFRIPPRRSPQKTKTDSSTIKIKNKRESKKTEANLPHKIVEEKNISKPDKNVELSASIVNTPSRPVAKKHTCRLSQRSSINKKIPTKNSSNSNWSDKEFNVDVFKDVAPAEIAEYKKLFPKLDNIADRPVHCTSCNSHIGTAPINEAIIKMHPVLRVIQCKKCYTFYTSGEFERGEDGSEFYCRWCGQGGEVYCCSKCPKVYCRRCIEQNLSKGKVNEIQNNENWICFACDPSCMIQLKADYWALLNFIEKQKKEITNKSLTEKELNEAMSKDCSKCCVNFKKRMYGKRKLLSPTDSSPPAKRIDMGTTPPPTIINDVLAKRAQSKKPTIPDGIKVQCSPDIGSLLVSGDNPIPPDIPTVRLVRQLKVVPINTSTPHSAQTPSQTVQQNMLLDVHTAPPTKNPVFHTINGFRVDLNSAAQQETFRLPNGKLIQVRKQQPTVTTVSKVMPIPTQVALQPTVTTVSKVMPIPTQVALTTISSSTVPGAAIAPLSLISSMTPSPISSPSLVKIPPPLLVPTGRGRPTWRGRGRGRPPNVPVTQIRAVQPIAPPQSKQMIQIRRNINSVPNNSQAPENQIHITSLSQTTRKRKKTGGIPIKVPDNSPVDKAKSQFEVRVENSMQVCQHIIDKMKTLTGSTAFKSVKTLTDVKDLTIHLSYLLTYAVGRFKTLQDKCGGDMKEMGFDLGSSKSDDDDIEILEPSTTLIDLDSDETDSDDLEQETRKAVEHLLNVQNLEPDVLDTVSVEESVSKTVKNVEMTVSETNEKVTEKQAPLIQQNGEENNDLKAAEKLINISDGQPNSNNKKPPETMTAEGYDIVEIHETVNVDKSEQEIFNEKGEKNTDAQEVIKPYKDLTGQSDKETIIDNQNIKENSNKESEIIPDTKAAVKSDKDISDKHNQGAETSEQKTENSTLKDEIVEIDVNPPSKNGNKNIIAEVTDSSDFLLDSGVPSNSTETKSDIIVENLIEKPSLIVENDIKRGEQHDARVEVIESIKATEKVKSPQDSKINDDVDSTPELIKEESQSDDSPVDKATTDQDTETEQLQKLLEENDDIDSPAIENLSAELNEEPLSKKRTNSEITINVSNVESIDEDIFENLIEEVNEVGENTNDESLTSEMNETSQTSSNGDHNILEDTDDKTNDKSKDSHEAHLSTEHLDDLSESNDTIHDENDLDLSLSSEIVLDPESDKVDEEMDCINEEDEKNMDSIEYIEEEIIENFEIVNETTDSISDPPTKESIDLDSSL